MTSIRLKKFTVPVRNRKAFEQFILFTFGLAFAIVLALSFVGLGVMFGG